MQSKVRFPYGQLAVVLTRHALTGTPERSVDANATRQAKDTHEKAPENLGLDPVVHLVIF